MIIKPRRKVDFEIRIVNLDGSSVSLKRKDHIKYLGVMIDDTISWKYYTAYVFQEHRRIQELCLSYERHPLTLGLLP